MDCDLSRRLTMSVAFSHGKVSYARSKAAVKGGLSVPFLGDDDADALGRSRGDLDNDALRLDFDDLGGEIVRLDWAAGSEPDCLTVSRLNQELVETYELMNGRVEAVLFQQSKAALSDTELYQRKTRLSRNRFIRPSTIESKDRVLADINDIPKICQDIQNDLQADKASASLNRLTTFHLSRCLRERLDAHIAGNVPQNAVDILITGCEVSLWVGEQFASDLGKVLPQLRISTRSSNKLLGTYGQEIAIPSVGFPFSRKTHSLHDTIIIIVSHSGGTFAPLACSSLLQVCTGEAAVGILISVDRS